MLHWRVRKSNSGFSLAEMLVTIILIGIVAAISAPNLAAMLNRSRSSEATKQIEGALREAQKQATRRGRSCSVEVSIATKNSALVNPDPLFKNPDGSDRDGCLVSSRQLHDNVSLVSDATLDSGRYRIDFSSKGNVADTPIVLVTFIADGNLNQQKCVVIDNALGRIRTGEYLEDVTATLNAGDCQ